MSYFSTLEVANLLGTKEHIINAGLRSGKLVGPAVVRGRRLWQRSHIIAAAVKLGISPPAELLSTRGRHSGLPENVERR
jgi:hypothetical protein